MTDVQVFEGDGKMPPEWVAMIKDINDLRVENIDLRSTIEKNAMVERNLQEQNRELRNLKDDLIRRLNKIHAVLMDGVDTHYPEPTDNGGIYEKRFLPEASPPTIYRGEPQQQMESLKNDAVRETKQKDLMERLLEMSRKPRRKEEEKVADDEEPSLW